MKQSLSAPQGCLKRLQLRQLPLAGRMRGSCAAAVGSITLAQEHVRPQVEQALLRGGNGCCHLRQRRHLRRRPFGRLGSAGPQLNLTEACMQWTAYFLG